MFMCVCAHARVFETIHNSRMFMKEDKIIQFYMELDEQHQSVQSQVLLMGHFPTINKALSMVSQEER